MKQFYPILALAAMTVAAGCAAPERSANGHSVRAIMASQIVPPQPQPQSEPPRGADGNAAMAGYVNYQRSYQSPTPQGSSAMIGSGLSK